MGSSAVNSIADSYDKTHEIDNLFIAGASLFAAIAAAEPTGIPSVVALRARDYIVSERAALIA